MKKFFRGKKTWAKSCNFISGRRKKMQGFTFDNIWQQQKMQQEYMNDCREMQKVAAKEAAKETIRIQSMQIKAQLREQEKERKKAVGEVLQIMENGELQLVSENLSVQAIPRRVTNMRDPKLTVLKRMIDEAEQIYYVRCFVGKREEEVFLEKNQAGTGSYILRKFASAGIRFFKGTAEAKKFAVQLISILRGEYKEEKLLPELEGWVKMPDGQFQYFGREDFTWDKVKKLCK